MDREPPQSVAGGSQTWSGQAFPRSNTKNFTKRLVCAKVTTIQVSVTDRGSTDTRVLRIGPNQLHISDPNLYKVIYSQVNPFPKEELFYSSFGTPHTLFAETDTKLHKERRKLLNPLFSRAGVAKLEPLILEKVEEVKLKIRRVSKAEPIHVVDVFR